jgi:hypothetical protein
MNLLGSIALIALGLALIVINAIKLVSDWRRMKPKHNVDLAFIQIILGIILLAVAWYLNRGPKS